MDRIRHVLCVAACTVALLAPASRALAGHIVEWMPNKARILETPEIATSSPPANDGWKHTEASQATTLLAVVRTARESCDKSARVWQQRRHSSGAELWAIQCANCNAFTVSIPLEGSITVAKCKVGVTCFEKQGH